MLHTRSDGSVVSSVSYGYDNAAVRNSLAYDHLAVTASFTHDALYRLTGEVWTGNRNATSYTNVIGADIGNESGYSPVAKGTPGALTDVPPHYQLYGFDAAGNRTSLNGISRVSTYTVDEENRLTGETPSTLSKVTGTTAAASDTDAGYSVTKINDGDTTDSTSATYAWKSLDQTGQHWAEISWSGSKPIRQVRVFLPTSPGEVQRFKVQYDNSGTWTDVTVLAVIGATSAGGGWYKSGLHENIFAISEVSTAKVRFLQDSGGGAPSSANVAYLNELEAYEVVAGSPISYTHNANGNMTQMSQGTTVRDYGFDYANRLNSYKKTVSSLVVDDWTYLAAPTGQRFMKKQTGSSTENLFVYDGQDVIGDYTKTGGTTTYDRGYVDGLGIDSKIARIEANETQRYYISDALGSMTHMLDAGASVISTTIGNAWGEDIVFSQSTADRHGFTGRERDLDTDSGLVHFRARTYRPGIGRFLQKDPVRRISAHHAYGSNSPANLVDPLGLLAVARIQDQTEEDDLKELTKEQAETVKSHRRRSGIKRPPWADVTDIERRRFIDVPFHIIRKYFSEFPHHFKPPEPEKEPKAERREGGTTWKFVPGRAVTEEEAIFIKTVYAIGDYGVPFGWVATWLLEEYVVKGAADRALDEKVQELTKAGMPLKEAKAAVDILIAGKGIAKKFFKSVRNYRSTFFKAHPHLEGKVVVHHAVEQQVLTRYPNVFSESEIHSLGNLRGIPKELNPEVHLSRIRTMWNEFYRSHPTVTPTLKEEILKKAAEIDREVGGVFLPPR
jgi:RHS repeat-associated protein